MSITATYSPEDNKLRLYPSSRLDAETYARVKAAGYSWAPKQELFVAPAWSPEREDLALELAGEIDDEDRSLVDRAEERADRFEDYRDKRAEDADRAHKAVSAIADGIPLGQPILVGHHSERHARKDAERIENGMRKAVKMWETAQYWKDRAAGALAHAEYKERPDVRARRIKGLESDLRRVQKTVDRSAKFTKAWGNVETLEQAQMVANYDHVSKCFTLAEFPRTPPASQYEGMMSLWSALDGGIIDAAQAREIALRVHARGDIPRARWVSHLNNRLTYERAMLGESGYTPPPKAATIAALPLLNYDDEVTYRNPFRKGETTTVLPVHMTKAELAAIYADYKGTRVSGDGTHRVRVAYVPIPGQSGRGLVAVFLTDSKKHPKPGGEIKTAEDELIAARISQAHDKIERTNSARAAIVRRNADIIGARAAVRDNEAPQDSEAYDLMRKSLKAGVQVVSAPQLFPTPPEVAAQVVELADIEPGMRVLEPSAGTGALLEAIPYGCEVVGVEINQAIAGHLRARVSAEVRCSDFLACNGDLGTFDRIVMNPPFADGSDIKHIQHARTFLREGGRLVAICANGPRQRAAFEPIAETWIDLPAGTFAGTMVNAAIVVLPGME